VFGLKLILPLTSDFPFLLMKCNYCVVVEMNVILRINCDFSDFQLYYII